MTPKIECVYILGAGASVPYGLPTVRRLAWEISRTLTEADRTVFDSAVFEAYGTKPERPDSEIDFEDLLNRLDPLGLSYLEEQDLGATLQNRKHAFQVALSGLRSFIQTKSLESRNKQGPYDKLVATLSSASAVVSFNWDVLLEWALIRAKREYAYLPKTEADSRQVILKPHGSINWYALLDRELLMVSSKSNLRAVGDDLTYYLLYRPDPFLPIDFKWSSPFVEAALSKVPAIVPPQSSKLLSVGGDPRDGFVESGQRGYSIDSGCFFWHHSKIWRITPRIW